MDVRMPDGTLIRGVPDGITKSQLTAKYAKYKAPVEEKTGFSKILDEGAQREAAIQGTSDSVISKGVQRLGSGAQTASDLAIEAIKQTMTEGTQQTLSSLGQQTYQDLSDIGSALPAATPEIDYRFSDETKRNINALTSMAGSIPALKGAKEVSRGAGVVSKAGAKAVLPQVDEGLIDVGRLAVKHDIPISFDQITSSRAVKNTQKVSQELPFSGQEKFRDMQLKKFNSALLKTVGHSGERVTPLKMRQAFSKVGKEFEDFGKGQTFTFNNKFLQDLTDIRQDAVANKLKDSIGNFDEAERMVLSEFDANNSISGDKLNKLRAKVNKLAREANNQDTADLLHQLEVALIDTMTSGNPQVQAAITAAKHKYKNLLVIEPLAAKAKGGNINPTLLNTRVSKVYGRQHVIGESGDIGELARVGHELMPELGGSDTVQKAIYAGKALAGFGATGTAATFAPGSTAATLGANRLLQAGVNRNQKLIKKVLK